MTRMSYEGRLSGEPATRETLTVGTRVYNHGDMANPDHFGTVTQVEASPYGTNYEITPDPDSGDAHEGKPYWIPAVMVSPEYKGNGLTRFVTEAEYERWHQARMEAMRRRMAEGRI